MPPPAPAAPAHRAPSGWQGPLRAAAAIFLAGLLVVWLVKPIGNPCPDLQRLPQGSAATSSPSFSPPGARTCTYTAAGGTKATATYVPWLDWMVLLLLAGVVAGAVRALSPAGGVARAERNPRVGPPSPGERRQRAERLPRADGQPRLERQPPGERPPRASSPGDTSERDAAERERARRERAARNREGRGR